MLSAEQQIRKEAKKDYKTFVKKSPDLNQQYKNSTMKQIVNFGLPDWDSSSKISILKN